MSAALTFPEQQWDQIQLAAAVLCQDCEIVSNTPYGCCPACGSQSLLQIARVLNREEACDSSKG